jgi:hypothetical protein
MEPTLLDSLRNEINERQDELQNLQMVVEKTAEQNSDRAKWIRVVIIFLGALAATRDVADKLFPNHSSTVIFSFTGFAFAITVLSSIMASFRYENLSAELKILAVECNTYILDIDRQLPMEGDTTTIETQITAAQNLIVLQNQAIKDIQTKAAKLGINIIRKARKLKTAMSA